MDLGDTLSAGESTPPLSARVAPAPVPGTTAAFHLSDSDTDSEPSVSGEGVRGAEPTLGAGFDMSDSSDD